MGGLLAFSRFVDGFNEKFGRIADYCVLFACLVSAGNATVRYLFSYSTNGLLEVQWYLFGAVVLLGAPYTLKRNEHVRVDLVYMAVSPRVRLWIDTLGFLLVLIPAGLYLTWLSFPFFWQSFEAGEVSQNAGGLILWPAKLLLPLGFALLTVQGLSELIKRIAALSGVLDISTDYEKPLQ
ncbi:TRAP transporter small permease subunit [Ancylobacter polymorphus]|jgi:TRAP-type mannitol/chloroaromatic compound transport system permease small subunit|uniref:TRAP transporter small permease protein n=1 Tax=Ancylobacter polymorphus TaxID=223390 RepID=A0A9E6ZPS0_9HYPH|nr:TRAP transporter small permease subunit [Ancylobacter polymorphus]MPT22196.1 TRAP transporter small permease subunit [Starkeya sp.]UOK69476.1 TRAP transporter small permease subunit [Ancylobacter polymorphus]